MKRMLMVVVIAVAAVSAAFGQMNKDEQGVRQVINDLTAALRSNDTAALDRIYADDYTFVGDTGVMMTKAERIAAFKSGELKYESISADVVGIRFYGDTAVAISRFTTKFAPGAKFPDGKVMTSLIFVKTKERWRLVAAHNTSVGE